MDFLAMESQVLLFQNKIVSIEIDLGQKVVGLDVTIFAIDYEPQALINIHKTNT